MMKINKKKGPLGLYIHIPFCLQKCRYCDFLSFSGYEEAVQKQYVGALIKEIGLYRGRQIELDTIFIGGGTPSLLRQEHIINIMKAAEAAFCVDKQAEITIEANPGTLNKDKLAAYRSAGINRLSMGAQSMDDGLLSFMGRAHDRKTFLSSYEMARQAGFKNINIDLMFGIPGQTKQMWIHSLQQVIGLNPEHLSLYSLQLEEGTAMCTMYRQEEIDLPSVEEDRWMYHEGLDRLKGAGYVHYEISNCAKAGYACRHNLKYWSFDEYLGVGLGAHGFGYDQGRTSNVTDFQSYYKAVDAGQFPQDRSSYQEESLSDFMGEYVFTALRTVKGLDTVDFARVFKEDFFQVYEDKMETILEYERNGDLVLQESRLFLTEKGFDCSNQIMAEFV